MTFQEAKGLSLKKWGWIVSNNGVLETSIKSRWVRDPLALITPPLSSRPSERGFEPGVGNKN